MTSKNFQANHQNQWLSYRSYQCQRSGNWKARIVASTQASMVGMAALVIRLPTLVARVTTNPSTRHRSDSSGHHIAGTGHRNGNSNHQPPAPSTQPTRLMTQPPDGLRETIVCFCKKIYQNFQCKIFYNGFYVQQKIFYKFDHILPVNKHLEMGKYFPINILPQNK